MILPGKDYEGHRIVYKYIANFKNSEQTEQVHLFIFDKVCKQINIDQESTFTVLFDITSVYKFDIYSFIKLSDLLKKNFKNRLHKLYIYPCGLLGHIAFCAVRNFLGSQTIKKIILVSKKEQLNEYFDKSVLPVHLGGTCNVLNTPRKFK